VELKSDLWLDQPDAHDRIDERLAGGRLTDAEAEGLHSFADLGYLTVSLDLDARFCAGFDADVARLWSDRPADLAVSPPSTVGPTRFSDYDGEPRPVGYRIPDMHSHSEHALDLYLSSRLFRAIQLIYDAPAIAFQSLYFEYGSQQTLHRDPMFVVTNPTSHLLASWVALEDISPDSGPLAYVPKSHRLPWFEFTPGSVVCGHGVPPETRIAFAEWTREQLAANHLEAKPFTCRRGDAFIWHGSLYHGGTPIKFPEQTRKSFVTHYCTAEHYRSRTASMRVHKEEGWRHVTSTTDRVIERDQQRGLDNPVHVP
jgi:Phytanoyl-CoA dioxygenase (PhyH)